MSIAYWCVLVAAILPYLTVAVAKASSPYDNRRPRAPETYKGMAGRAHGAHNNGFETFPFFAIAVLVATSGSPLVVSGFLNTLALVWVVIRLMYIAAYLLDRASIRSVLWIAGLIVNLVIFTMPAWHP